MIKSYLCWMDHSEIDITKNKYLSQINILINVELYVIYFQIFVEHSLRNTDLKKTWRLP